jgi:hypothetical protein
MSQPSKNPSQQPISFKTVPGRNRTQKWTQAKTNNYDGDDWGGYDDYDDYGGYQEPSSSQQQSGPQLQRQSSFDRGVDTERRQFSSGTAIYEPERYTSPSRSGKEIVQDGNSPEETRRRMREFSNPGQVPQPLNTPRSPETPRSVDRPPRKSSLGSGSPGPDVRATPAATSPLSDKPLSFVRPSDIYKRMAEEQQKERQSMESGRPSMDTIHRDMGSPSTAQHILQRKRSQDSLPSSSGRRPSLDPVSEAMEPKSKSPERSLPTVAESSTPNTFIAQPSIQPAMTPHQSSLRPSDSSPRLPPVSRVSGFGSFMPRDEEEERISATGLAASTAAANAAASALSSGSRDVTPTMPAHQSQALRDQSTNASDPAADIAAERRTAAPVEQLGRSANEDPSGLSHQPLSGSGPLNDPAADIAAQRRTGAPVEQLGRSANEDPSGLSHQPSSGFRSVVHKAFDRQGDNSIPASPISRDNTQSGVSRSDTNSTGSISPIMSRVPSAATAEQRHQERDTVVSPIAEETPLDIARSRPAQDSTAPPASPRPNIMRKPTPSHSRNVSNEIVGFTPGYRRSMETPSPNNSPARTPGLGDTDTRRLSGPMSAVTVHDPEAPDVDPSAPEMPSATLRPVETPLLDTTGSIYPGASGPEVVKPLPTTGRGRSGTDYSVRESDLAHEANTSPENSPAVAEAATIHQNLFLDNHPSNPSSPTALSPTTGIARPFPLPAGSGSGRNSPAGTSRSRVRNIVDQFQQIDDNSKRNSTASGMSSKSSWSNFGGDEDNLPGLNRRATGGSALSQQTPGENAAFSSYEQGGRDTSAARSATSPSRPAAERLESFKPHLPGEWVSAAPTPASEVPEPISLNTERGRDHSIRDITPTPNIQPLASPGEEVDLTPTTRKTKLHGRDSSADIDHSQSALSAVKNAGDALGTAFMSSVGFGHQTQDFANKGSAAPVDIPELRPHRQTGNIEHINLPILRRGDSDAPSDGTNSVANSVPPTPPAKDTPKPRGLAANSGPTTGRPVSNYFAGVIPDAPAPLSFGKHSPNNSRDFASSRPTVLPTLSTDTRATDFESDRLRKDIVRSLGPEKMAELKRESILEDVDRTQDALDAPENGKRIASGQSALPAAEAKSPDARSGLPSQARPGLLDQRFSWENKAPDNNDRLYSHMAVVGETKGDENRESYERPRSNQGLHVVNTQVTADSEPSTADTDKQVEPHFMVNEPADAETRLSSALPIGTAALALGSQGNTLSDNVVSPIPESPETSHGGLDNLAPSPMVEDIDEAARSAESRSPDLPRQEDSPTLPSAPTAAAQAPSAASNKIPAFRDLAAIKNTEDRIAAYETTRHRFADMNTGLSGWLSGMLSAHPEYANAGSERYQGPAVIQTAGLSNTISGLGGTIRGASHKHSPSILKIGGERKASTTSTTAATPTNTSTGSNADVDKIQAKGKDFMKSAGAGAKGLFAKGKSRFGRSGEKVE